MLTISVTQVAATMERAQAAALAGQRLLSATMCCANCGACLPANRASPGHRSACALCTAIPPASVSALNEPLRHYARDLVGVAGADVLDADELGGHGFEVGSAQLMRRDEVIE